MSDQNADLIVNFVFSFLVGLSFGLWHGVWAGTCACLACWTFCIKVDGLKERIGQAGVQIWDARSIEEYDGRNDRGNARKGHVPGANNAEWTQMMSNDDLQTFRPAAEMWEVIDRLGLSPDKEIVSYCQGGIRAAHANFVLTLLGFTNARNYDGSMREWANRDDTPLVLP